MTDHQRLLGTLFLVWGGVMLVAAWFVAAPIGLVPTDYPLLVGGLTTICAALFIIAGLQMKDGQPAGPLAVALCVLALFIVPVGTALGAYGLWVILRGRRRVPA